MSIVAPRILNRVARSFALSLRLLPSAVRESISLAYLLARLSDTQADGATTSEEIELLALQPVLEAALATSPDRDLIQNVWDTIRTGQDFDKTRFPGPPLDAIELDRYTYLVAGCVGEFWTNICLRRTTRFSNLPTETLLPLGRTYGQALQLVNILRDRHRDAASERIYLPEQNFLTTINRVREMLDCADTYIRSLRRGRLRAATALPALLARATLDAIERNPAAHAAKIPRRKVYSLLLRSLCF